MFLDLSEIWSHGEQRVRVYMWRFYKSTFREDVSASSSCVQLPTAGSLLCVKVSLLCSDCFYFLCSSDAIGQASLHDAPWWSSSCLGALQSLRLLPQAVQNQVLLQAALIYLHDLFE